MPSVGCLSARGGDIPIVHKNRRGHAYYLHVGRTRTGKPKYFFSRKESGELASELPEGFEVYEHPDGPVYLRRALPRLITDEEVAVVERELGRVGLTRRGFVERNLKTLTVYVADVGGGLEAALGSIAPFAGGTKLDSLISEFARYTAVFQFVLTDERRRRFQARRYCYLGSVDDWINIGAAGALEDVARKYLQHTNKESYYELF